MPLLNPLASPQTRNAPGVPPSSSSVSAGWAVGDHVHRIPESSDRSRCTWPGVKQDVVVPVSALTLHLGPNRPKRLATAPSAHHLRQILWRKFFRIRHGKTRCRGIDTPISTRRWTERWANSSDSGWTAPRYIERFSLRKEPAGGKHPTLQYLRAPHHRAIRVRSASLDLAAGFTALVPAFWRPQMPRRPARPPRFGFP